ncbi:SEL1-like repeat protein [Aliamphritea spongicola]|uniref:SEL1-like repeat protein n=1 Tax=Aliamphritea spongicola TaxID=707589 RepID=UPI00196A8DDD|nr:SEL1-like repeat protein [Aliamphritea spongicola]MBN3563022.1 SEL1-like repeat protein [Aliamphritea spongicola]
MFAKKPLLLSVLLAAGSASALADHDPQGPACLDRLAHEDYAAANTICSRLADAGDAQGLFAMGRIYGESLGRKGDQVKSVELLTKSVAAGYTPAAYYLGIAYEYGRGVEQNLPQAVGYYRQAAAENMPESQFKLGQMLLKGSGVKQDLNLGERWLRLAARAGHQDAQVTLAILLAGKDHAASLSWYQKAALQENPDALYNLAAIYFNGEQVEADLPRALEYAQRSKVAGHDKADVLHSAISERLLNLYGPTAAGKPASSAFDNVAGLKNRDWLFSQPKEKFVLQLAQFKDEPSLNGFLRDNNLQGKVDYYRSVTVLGPVYVVLYRHQFGTYGEAKRGMQAQLPAEVAEGGWIRQLSALQDVYKPTGS